MMFIWFPSMGKQAMDQVASVYIDRCGRHWEDHTLQRREIIWLMIDDGGKMWCFAGLVRNFSRGRWVFILPRLDTIPHGGSLQGRLWRTTQSLLRIFYIFLWV